MWATIRGINGDPDELQLTFIVDAEQLASVTAHLADNRLESDRKFQIIPQVTGEVVREAPTDLCQEVVILPGGAAWCVDEKGHTKFAHTIEVTPDMVKEKS